MIDCPVKNLNKLSINTIITKWEGVPLGLSWVCYSYRVRFSVQGSPICDNTQFPIFYLYTQSLLPDLGLSPCMSHWWSGHTYMCPVVSRQEAHILDLCILPFPDSWTILGVSPGQEGEMSLWIIPDLEHLAPPCEACGDHLGHLL